jgi:hypothetical protein
MYNQFKTGKIVILKQCAGIILAIPQLPRNPDELDDVQKLNNKADDRYDAFRLGLFGEFKSRSTPDEEAANQHMQELDPFQRYIYAHKKKYEFAHAKDTIHQTEVPYWQTKIQ